MAIGPTLNCYIKCRDAIPLGGNVISEGECVVTCGVKNVIILIIEIAKFGFMDHSLHSRLKKTDGRKARTDQKRSKVVRKVGSVNRGQRDRDTLRS